MTGTHPPRKLVIAFDCDDVLVPTSHKLLEAYDKEYGTNVDPVYLYEEHPSWGALHGDAVRRVLDLHKQKVVVNAAPLPEVVAAIKGLHKAGHELHVVTGRHEFQTEDTLMQLEKYFPGIFTSVEFTSYFGAASRNKADVCQGLGVDIFIDDHVDHCNSVSRGGITTILYGDYPWNDRGRIQIEPGIVRCPSMQLVVQEVERVARR